MIMYKPFKEGCDHEMTEPSAVGGKNIGLQWEVVNHWSHCTKCWGTKVTQEILWIGEGPDPRNEEESAMNKPLYKVAFTGHRPNKIGGYNAKTPMRVAVTKAINNALARAVAKYSETHEVVVISGGALGVDTDAADAADAEPDPLDLPRGPDEAADERRGRGRAKGPEQDRKSVV